MVRKRAHSHRLLASDTTVAELAAASRAAALEFTNGAETWAKSDLGEWLAGPYRRVTSAVSGSRPSIPPLSQARTRPSSVYSVTPGRSIAPAAVDDVLSDALTRVLTVLENASISRRPTAFAEELLARGHVVRVTDARGAHGFAPVASAHMRLVHRVVSLFAASALANPHDWATLGVCYWCARVRLRCEAPSCVCAASARR
jgi:hypothetical protein